MIGNLQLLRALAAWAVVLHHLRGPMAEIWAPVGETLVFAFGVDLFFVISGFVMAHITASGEAGPGAFLWRRAARIAPLYWLVTLWLALMLVAGMRPVGISAWSVEDLLLSLGFVANARADGYPGPLLGVGWTLTYEAAFYALFAAALALRRLWSPALTVVGAILLLVSLGAALRPEGFAARTYFAPILLEFAFGVLLACYRPAGSAAMGVVWVCCGLIGALVGALALARIGGADLITPGGIGAGWRTVFFGLPAAAVTLGALMLARSGWDCRSPTLLAQGAASYALYLLHLPLLQMVGKAVGEGPALLVVGVPAVALAALWVHRWIERPMTDWLYAAAPRGGVRPVHRGAGLGAVK